MSLLVRMRASQDMVLVGDWVMVELREVFKEGIAETEYGIERSDVGRENEGQQLYRQTVRSSTNQFESLRGAMKQVKKDEEGALETSR